MKSYLSLAFKELKAQKVMAVLIFIWGNILKIILNAIVSTLVILLKK